MVLLHPGDTNALLHGQEGNGLHIDTMIDATEKRELSLSFALA